MLALPSACLPNGKPTRTRSESIQLSSVPVRIRVPEATGRAATGIQLLDIGPPPCTCVPSCTAWWASLGDLLQGPSPRLSGPAYRVVRPASNSLPFPASSPTSSPAHPPPPFPPPELI